MLGLRIHISEFKQFRLKISILSNRAVVFNLFKYNYYIYFILNATFRYDTTIRKIIELSILKKKWIGSISNFNF